ncbi:MAG TPA: diaminopimelate epimerase [Phycisphaerae bacterium]|nr:diaminopimelate epimerase [Phycisphaerae bacterium]HPS52277.1 diaminopimelate epimerase [Phycisphaerae bacterium]
MESVEFTKLTACGNDFICIDNLSGQFDSILSDSKLSSAFARGICDRHKGVGADGVIFACKDGYTGGLAEISSAHFESDGSFCELCGNGSACFTRWVVAKGILPDRQINILTPAGIIQGQCIDRDYVRVCISPPENHRPNLNIECESADQKKTFVCDYIVTGIPHVVTIVDNVSAVNVRRWGYQLRHHPAFKPRGVNANFVQILSPGRIAMRTFEFGVEDETLACGTGASACAIVTALKNDWPPEIYDGTAPVIVRTRGGEILRVYITRDESGAIVDCCLESRARVLYTGVLNDVFLLSTLESR